MPEPQNESVMDLDVVLAEDNTGEDAPKEGSDYGENNEQLPDELQNALRSLAQHFLKQETVPRREEIKEAREQRYYWRGIQYIYWSNDDNAYQPATSSSGLKVNGKKDVEMPKYMNVYNIYQQYMRSLISVLTQNAPGVRFEPSSPSSALDITIAEKAQLYKHVVERNNDMKKLQADVARFYCTDGRVAVHTRYVKDGQRFGFEGEAHVDEQAEGIQDSDGSQRVARGQEVFTAYGVLEVKVPILLNDFSDFPYLALSVEKDCTQLKAQFPKIADQIEEGGSTLGEAEYARLARLGVLQGSNSRLNSDAYTHLVTVHRIWLRPSAFTEAPEEVRDELRTLFPDGAYACFVGSTYAESRNESMDDHWAVRSALPSDGQASPSLGKALVPIQDVFNDLMNLVEEIYDYCIPSIWIDTEIGDIDAINDQISEPGARIPAKRRQGEALETSFYAEPPAEVPPDMIAHLELLQGQLAQFVTGALPALFGGNMEDNDTASGYAMARDQAMGQMGLVWASVQMLWARIMQQAIRCAAYNRKAPIEVPARGQGQGDATSIAIEDLKGNLLCFPDTDSSFPDTWSARRSVYMQILNLASGNPDLAQVVSQPDNLVIGKDLIGLEDLTIPGAASRNKQLREIDQLLKETPVPNEQALHLEAVDMTVAKVTGQAPPAPPNPEDVMNSSLSIDPIFDDHQIEFAEVQKWLNSEDGADARIKNPKGWMNVRLHGLAHYKQVLQQQAQAAAAAGPKPKGPSESINFKDLPPEGQAQMAEQAGISLTVPPPPPPGGTQMPAPAM